MNLVKIKEKIVKKLIDNESMPPFLFVTQDLEILNEEIKKLSQLILNEFIIPKTDLFILEDNGEKIKIEEIKKFINPSKTKTPHRFQIFFIENISRMTLQSANSCLKFFEEPGSQNIIFLSNSWENFILETILSRVQTISLQSSSISKKDNFYYDLIENCYKSWDFKCLISYVFKNKLEKEEQIKILENLVLVFYG